MKHVTTTPTKFVHFRAFRDDAVLPNGGITVAYEVNISENEHTGDRFSDLVFAVARCHARDNYNKHLGRQKSKGRLMSKDHVCSTSLEPEDNPVDVLTRLVNNTPQGAMYFPHRRKPRKEKTNGG